MKTYDLKCDCDLCLRIAADSVEEAVGIILKEGWKLKSDNKKPIERIADHIKVIQDGGSVVMPAFCNKHNPDKFERKGMKISDLIDALFKIKFSYGDLICQVQDGLDPSDFADVTGLRVEMDIGCQIVKIDA